MNIQQANGTLWPDVTREEYFKRENPRMPGVVFLKDLGGGGTDVQIHTAPDADGVPGTFTLRATVTVAAGALEMQTLPVDDVYIRLTPLTSKVAYSIHSSSPFHYDRHKA